MSSPQDSDDDEVSTPSGDNTERNPLSGSCESIDTAVRRKEYLKSAFDSLSGAEMDTTLIAGHNSLSSQHLSRPRNSAPAPSPAPRTPGKNVDPDAARRREELNRRILETRRQLESVAFRSNLKSSQSTTDLSYIPEKDGARRARPASMAVPSNTRPYGITTYQEEALDSLNSNYYDSLNPYQNNPMNLDYRNKNPYDIPANLNHKIPEYIENMAPYVPPHANLPNMANVRKEMNFQTYNKPVVFKEQIPQRQNLAFTIDLGKKPVQSKVFNRLFPTKEGPKEPPKIPPRNFQLNLTKVTDEKPQKLPKPSARSIFKNYKSCPVSPVSEECKWSDKIPQNQQRPNTQSMDPKKRNSLSFFIGLDNKVLRDNGKSLVDTIKNDTEKMIAEIKRKYGDLDEYDVSGHEDLDLHPTKEVENDDGNFSSDSLEDCSLSQDASCKNKLYSKKVCKKHTKAKSLPRRAISDYQICDSKPVVPTKPSYIGNQKSSTLPRNMPSNLDDIEDEDYPLNANYMYRCQSVLTKRCITRSNESVLSDNSNGSSVSNEIFLKYGNEGGFQQAKFDSRFNLNSQNCSYENLNENDGHYLDNHRHSSASFFLNQKKYMKNSCSQESVLSDDMYLEDNHLCRTNCNSLESVLSDESECTKSAPLEMLFEGTKAKKMQKLQNVNIPRNSKSCYEFENTSKSYGSSPNTKPSFANYYMQYNYLGTSPQKDIPKDVPPPLGPKPPPTNKIYGFEVPVSEFSGHKTVTRSKSLHDSTQPPPAKPIAYYFDGSNIQAYTKGCNKKDEIPRLDRADYMANTTKSLQPQCANKHKYKSQMDGCESNTAIKSNTMIKSKSCSFEVVLEPASKPNPIKNLIEKRNSHVQKNLEKFEEQIKKNQQTKVSKNQHNKEKANSKSNATKSLERGSSQKNNGKVTMEFVPHKPPKPVKRTSSVKINNKLKAGLDKSGLSSSISSHYKAKLDGLQNKNYLAKKQADNNSNVDCDSTEKTFDVFVKEKDVNENKSEIQMDSLEVFAMQRIERMKQVSMDSLDVIEDSNDFAKDSLDYYAEQSNKKFLKNTKDHINLRTKSDAMPSHSQQSDSKENIAPTEEIQKFKYLERKIEIINKLVEMEERKILQEKVLKEWRMRPLKANINDGKGVVKVLSRKFEKLATKQCTVPNFASLTLEEADTDTENSENKEIKRNLSLPDILDSDQIGEINSNFNSETIETDNESGNQNTVTEVKPNNEDIENRNDAKPSNIDQNVSSTDTKLNNTVKSEISHPKSLKQRVYNEMVIPKTDLHLDSENYESSTTSSSCTNSPKRMTFYGFSRPKTPFRKVVRVPTPRLCMEKNPRPVLGLPRASLSRRLPLQAPVLPSKFFTANRNLLSPSDAEEESSGMRRAISLSDLAAKPMPAPRTPQVAGPPKQTSPQNGGTNKSPSGFVRPAPRHNSKTNMTRSSSVGVLNQSDSESDGQPSRQNASRAASGLMRPTISSMNKQANNSSRRRGMANAYSAMSLSTGAQEESSSEAEERQEKPAVPPRPRAGSVDHSRRIGRSGSERDLSAKAREVTARLTANTRQRNKPDSPGQDNLSSSELCSALTEQLTRTATRVVHLYRTLQQQPASSADISGLEAAILETQKVLRGAVVRNGEPEGTQADGAIDNTRQRLEHLVAKEGAANPAMSVLEQYSDILLNMMQSKMVTQLSQPHSLPAPQASAPQGFAPTGAEEHS
ncbi:hypothetical protein O0L34_g12274 [Tuta absoluta]|nr:hypothetical protein O0L34_g12274 [Tuta absoluta]